jgi:uncharacterized protein
VRLDDASLGAVDLLVQSGLAQSRSEGASQLISLGIRAADDLLLKARELADNVNQIKQSMIDAVRERNVSKVRNLLEQDSTLVDAKSDGGQTAVLLSAYYHANEVRDLLLSKGPAIGFYEACAIGNTERVQEALEEDPSLLNVHNSDGYTPLGLAAFFGHEETALTLLRYGAHVNQLSTDGDLNNTALHAATAGHYRDIVEILLAHGADVNARSHGAIRQGFTPLHVAAGRGFHDIAELLLQYGADIHAQKDDGQTAASYAKQRGFGELSSWLQAHDEKS